MIRPSWSTCPLRVTPVLLLGTLFLSATPSPSTAQETEPGLVEAQPVGRHGFWVGLGLGAGGESYDLGSGSSYSEVLYRPTVSLRLGGTVGQHLRLGGEVLSWINENGPAIESLSSALFIAQYYPSSALGLYLKGGIGIGRNAVDFDDGSNAGDTGFAGLIGAGYEIRLGKRFYLNPVVDLVGHTYDDRYTGGYRERLVHFGLGVLMQM